MSTKTSEILGSGCNRHYSPGNTPTMCIGRGRGVNQAYSRLSTPNGHITDCKLNSVVYEGVCVVI